MREEFEKPYFKTLLDFVKRERAEGAVYPPPGDVMSAFHVAYESISVVILGQDPYHGPRQAHGLAFSVRPGVKTPPSLANIYKELANDVGFREPGHGYLRAWANQGVFLLNTTLTVRSGKAASHQGEGWEEFTDAVIRHLDKREHLVFMLWGGHAKKKLELITPRRHLWLLAAHPSPLSAHSGFFGCKHFSEANAYLKRWGVRPINWQLPDDPEGDVPLPDLPPPPPPKEEVDVEALLKGSFGD